VDLYDVIIVGAGPAGAVAALRLAARGARVLLLEKQALGRDKPCGGGLTPRAWSDLEVDIADVVLSRTDSGALRHGRRHEARVPLGDRAVWMVRRRDFDQRLAAAAGHAGADVHEREPARAVDATRSGVVVRTPVAAYRGQVALIATGAEAPLRAALGYARVHPRMAVAVEMEGRASADGLDPREFIFDFDIPGGYAWAFPKGEWWNVGVLSASAETAPQLRRLLAGFVVALGIRFQAPADPVRATGRRIPLHAGRCSLAVGRTALIGDAAALADPLFGEGIAQALMSGRLAAVAAESVLSGRRQDLGEYPRLLQRTIGPHLRRMRWLARAVYAQPALAVRALSFGPPQAVARHLSTEPFAGQLDTVARRAALAASRRHA
jgi:geranylgeranyl reductase family protein